MELSKQPENDAKNKDQLVIIGDSGAGKSVFVNYMAGASMLMKYDEIRKMSVIDINNEGKGHHIYSPIGHFDKSMTFIPTIINKEKIID